MKTQRVADLIVDVLYSAGVRRIYGIVGDSLNGITDAVSRCGDIEWVHTRHEEAAAFAAGAEAHLMARSPFVCGPGNLHLINGLFEAHRSCVIPSAEIGRGYFQETHPDQLFRECSHYCELISHPSQLPAVLEAPRLREFDPTLRLSNLERVAPPFRRPEDRARYADGLRRAGLLE